MLSGLRATVIMEDGKSLNKGSVEKAITSKGLEFKGMETKKMPIPKVEYVLAVTGTT